MLDSNRLQVQHAIDRIVETGKKKVGLLGFSFKAGTDDLRESPMVILAEALLGKGYQLTIYDRNVSLARLVGANKQYIEEQIPHLSRHLCESIDEVIDQSEVIVVGNASPEFSDAIMRCRPDQIVIDLVRIPARFQQAARTVRRNLLVAGDASGLPVRRFRRPAVKNRSHTGSGSLKASGYHFRSSVRLPNRPPILMLRVFASEARLRPSFCVALSGR